MSCVGVSSTIRSRVPVHYICYLFIFIFIRLSLFTYIIITYYYNICLLCLLILLFTIQHFSWYCTVVSRPIHFQCIKCTVLYGRCVDAVAFACCCNSWCSMCCYMLLLYSTYCIYSITYCIKFKFLNLNFCYSRPIYFSYYSQLIVFFYYLFYNTVYPILLGRQPAGSHHILLSISFLIFYIYVYLQCYSLFSLKSRLQQLILYILLNNAMTMWHLITISTAHHV